MNTAGRRIEWPTMFVIVGTYLVFAAVLVWHRSIPTVLTVAVLAIASMQHSSLQHEVIHRHPTPWQRVNEAMVWLPVGLFAPYERFKETHLDHHANDESLTDPIVDPESNYITPQQWDEASQLGRMVLWANRMLAGRLLFGPARSITRFIMGDLRLARTSWHIAAIWLRHLVGVAAVLTVVWAAGLPIWIYALGAGYCTMSLVGLRAFAEHRGVATGTRSAMVRTSWFFQLLYLNNALHHTHHSRPGAAWYRLPALADELGSDEAAAAGAGLYRGGYGELARRFMFRPFCQPVNPLLDPHHGSVELSRR